MWLPVWFALSLDLVEASADRVTCIALFTMYDTVMNNTALVGNVSQIEKVLNRNDALL